LCDKEDKRIGARKEVFRVVDIGGKKNIAVKQPLQALVTQLGYHP